MRRAIHAAVLMCCAALPAAAQAPSASREQDPCARLVALMQRHGPPDAGLSLELAQAWQRQGYGPGCRFGLERFDRVAAGATTQVFRGASGPSSEGDIMLRRGVVPSPVAAEQSYRGFAASQLQGEPVSTQTGALAGEIIDIVEGPAGHHHALIGLGPSADMRVVSVPLGHLQLVDNRLVVLGFTGDQLRARERYRVGRPGFSPVDPGTRVRVGFSDETRARGDDILPPSSAGEFAPR